jgi:hypothetical protein
MNTDDLTMMTAAQPRDSGSINENADEIVALGS